MHSNEDAAVAGPPQQRLEDVVGEHAHGHEPAAAGAQDDDGKRPFTVLVVKQFTSVVRATDEADALAQALPTIPSEGTNSNVQVLTGEHHFS